MSSRVEIEEIECVVCGNYDYVGLEVLPWKGVDLQYVLCSGCGLKFMHQRPTAEWYAKFYEEEFWQSSRVKKRDQNVIENEGELQLKWDEDELVAHGRDAEVSFDALIQGMIEWGSLERQRWRARRTLRNLSPVLSSLSSASMVLEIGAGLGEASALMQREFDCTPFAVEPSKVCSHYLRTVHKIEVLAPTVEALANRPELIGKFDLIVLNHVLENTTDPIQNLGLLKSLLSEAGHIYVDTCNFYYNNAVNPYHPYIFSPESLAGVLARSGLEVAYAYHAPHPDTVRWLQVDFRSQEPLENAIYLAVIAIACSNPRHDVNVDVQGLLRAQDRACSTLVPRAGAYVRFRRRLARLNPFSS